MENGKSRSLINFLVNDPRETEFLESVDVSIFSRTGVKFYDLLVKYVEQIGTNNVVQVVIENVSANFQQV